MKQQAEGFHGLDLVAEGRLERAFWHDDIKGDVEGNEHDDRKQEGGEQGLPERNTTDKAHEADDQEETCDVKPEPLRQQAEQQRGNEDLHDATQLVLREEYVRATGAHQQGADEPVKTGAREDDAEIEWEVARLRPVRFPRDAGAPIVEAEERCQGEQQQRRDDVDGARGDDGRRIVRRRGRVFDDDFSVRRGHSCFRGICGRTVDYRPFFGGPLVFASAPATLASRGPLLGTYFLLDGRLRGNEQNFDAGDLIRSVHVSSARQSPLRSSGSC